MPLAKWHKVVSFSSEDPQAPASNVTQQKRWRCRDAGEPRAWILLSLEQPKRMTSVHLGNHSSAFMEVLVSRGSENEEDMKVLLPAASFMTPMESRNEDNANRVRIFQKDKLNADALREKWDRIKIVCTQPFNKRIKYGLSFIQVHVEEDDESQEAEQKKAKATHNLYQAEKKKKLGAFTLRAESSLLVDNYESGSLFSKRKLGGAGANIKQELKNEKSFAAKCLEEQPEKGEKKKPLIPKTPREGQRRDSPQHANKKLPRRNIMPGEDSPPRKRPREEESGAAPRQPEPGRKRFATKPFGELLKDVVFTISGIQNPGRGEIRKKALDMGAKYRPDWDSECAFLICAFANTPKFNQVKKEGRGKIVKKDWIERCHADKKRYPWRRFCLDPKESKKAESEDEIWDESLVPCSERKAGCGPATPDSDDAMDTDEEIEAFIRQEERKKKLKEKEEEEGLGPADDGDSAYDASTDEDSPKRARTATTARLDNDSDAAFDADTDVDTDNEAWPQLPEFYSKNSFYLSGFSADEERGLVRKIVASGGIVERYMSGRVKYVVTCSDWRSDFDELLKNQSKVRFVKPSFVHNCWKKQELLNWADYAIRKK